MIRIRWGSRVYRWICVKSDVNLLAAFPQFVRKCHCSIRWKLIMEIEYTIKILSFEFIEMEGRFTLQRRV